MTGMFQRLLGRLVNKTIEYEEAKNLAASADTPTRQKLATQAQLMPELLYYLANDPAPEVRREIAANAATPPQANLLLAKDSDPDVRQGLAAKIARLAPGLGADERDRLRRMTYETLEMLARDQMPRVRQIIAETLKDVANAPPEVIRRLARDSEIVVAQPVLEFSPVLTDDDLLEIISTGPIKGALSAIGRRQGVSASIADAISGSADVEAIAALLGNKSAQIREETLDRLIERAPDIELWHAPLVQRPHLSARAAGRIARFVADNLLEALRSRQDLDPTTMAEVAKVVHRRLEIDDAQVELRQPRRDAKAKAEAAPPADPLVPIRKRMADGRLEEPDILKELAAKKIDFVQGALAVRAGVGLELVKKVIENQSAKGMVAVASKAGLSPAAAEQLQVKLAHVSPSAMLRGRGNAHALAEDEVDWQIGFFKSLVADSR
jgi:uncharacterized protein (DUF2336 family)